MIIHQLKPQYFLLHHSLALIPCYHIMALLHGTHALLPFHFMEKAVKTPGSFICSLPIYNTSWPSALPLGPLQHSLASGNDPRSSPTLFNLHQRLLVLFNLTLHSPTLTDPLQPTMTFSNTHYPSPYFQVLFNHIWHHKPSLALFNTPLQF